MKKLSCFILLILAFLLSSCTMEPDFTMSVSQFKSLYHLNDIQDIYDNKSVRITGVVYAMHNLDEKVVICFSDDGRFGNLMCFDVKPKKRVLEIKKGSTIVVEGKIKRISINGILTPDAELTNVKSIEVIN